MAIRHIATALLFAGLFAGSIRAAPGEETNRAAGAADAARLSAAQEMVFRAYRDILHREPDAGGLQFHASNLLAGTWNEAQLRQALGASPEVQARKQKARQMRKLARVGIITLALFACFAWWQRRRLSLFGDWLWLPLALVAAGTVLLLFARLCIWSTAGPWPVLRFAVIAAIITFGPGLFWLRVLRVVAASAADRFLIVIITSLSTTALLCWLAYSAGVYHRGVLIAILCALAAAGLHGGLAVDWRAAARWPARFWKRQGILARLVTAFLCIYMLEQLIACAGSPFTVWDAVISWDKWGCDMAERSGLGAYVMGGYPQFLPTLYSVFYKASGAWSAICPNEQLLLHGWGLIFLPLLIAGTYRLCGLLKARWEPAVAVMLGFAATRQWIPAGYADIPQAALVVSALALTLGLVRGEWAVSRRAYGALLPGLVFFALGFIKGSGIPWVLGMPLLACVWGSGPGLRARVMPVLGGVLVAALCAGPFYAHQSYYSKHLDKAEPDEHLHSFTVSVGHPGLLEKDRTAQQSLIDFGGGFLAAESRGRFVPAAVVSAAGLLVLAGCARRGAWLLAAAAALAALIWWRTAAYDWRNALPFIAVTGVLAGAGVGQLQSFGPLLWRRLIVAGTTALFGLPWFLATAAGSNGLLPGKAARALDAWRCEPARRDHYLDETYPALKRLLEASPPGQRALHVYCNDALFRFLGEKGIYSTKPFAYTGLTSGDLFVERYIAPPPGFEPIGVPPHPCCKVLLAYRPEWRTAEWTVISDDASAMELRVDGLQWAPGDWLSLRLRLKRGDGSTATWAGPWDSLAQQGDVLSFAKSASDALSGSVWWSNPAGVWRQEDHRVRILKGSSGPRVEGIDVWLLKGEAAVAMPGAASAAEEKK